MVIANRWLGCIKTYRLSWYLTAVSANHASSNSAQTAGLMTLLVLAFLGENIRAPGGGGRGDSCGGL